jgi:hypothetical protein
MKHNIALTVASLLSIVFTVLHLADDIVRGMEKGGVSNLIAVPILVIWLYGTLELIGRRSGYLIILLGSLLGMLVPWIHFAVPGGVAHGEIAKSGGALLFVGTQLALGVTSLFSVILAVRGLWRPTRGRTQDGGELQARRAAGM